MADIPVYVEDLDQITDSSVLEDDNLFILNQDRRSKGLPLSVLQDKIGGGGSSETLAGIVDTTSSKVPLSTDITGWTTKKFIEEAFTGVVPGTVSLSAPASKTLEKGDDQTNVVMTATPNAGSTVVTELVFKVGGTTVDTVVNPVGAQSYTVPSVTTNTTFQASITDTAGVHNSNTRSYTFVYPYYWGVGGQGLTPTQLVLLTKTIKSRDTQHTQAFTTVDNVPYYVYPASYGALSSILDQNGFEVLPDWTQRTEDLTGLDGTPQSYYVYEFKNKTTATATYNFKL